MFEAGPLLCGETCASVRTTAAAGSRELMYTASFSPFPWLSRGALEFETNMLPMYALPFKSIRTYDVLYVLYPIASHEMDNLFSGRVVAMPANTFN